MKFYKGLVLSMITYVEYNYVRRNGVQVYLQKTEFNGRLSEEGVKVKLENSYKGFALPNSIVITNVTYVNVNYI